MLVIRRAVQGIAIMALMMFPASAQIRGLTAISFQAMNSLSSATNLPTIPAGTVEAFVVCEGQSVRWRDDGTAPTASVGMLLPVSTPFPYIGSIPKIQFIQTTASATCEVTYYAQQ